jgi:hypothetical protein
MLNRKITISFYEKSALGDKSKIEMYAVSEIDLCMIFMEMDEGLMDFSKVYLTGWHPMNTPDSQFSKRNLGKIKVKMHIIFTKSNKLKKLFCIE